MNKVFFIGNLTRDVELNKTTSDISVCHFSIAVNRPYTNADGERQTDFFNCTAWRGLAETIVKYCKKGSKVMVAGHVETGTYEDSTGAKRPTFEIIVKDVEFLTPKASGAGGKPVPEVYDDDGDIPFN